MTELEKAYDHTKVEEKIYKTWEESGYFNPDKLPGDRKQPYTIIMPPPNANAPMHLGHALFVTIEDILIRYKRMRGYKTLWQPGTDHAGFETQVVFEKKLEKEGRSRFQMTREEFYKEVSGFVQSNKHITENSLRRLGASCDWDRNIFTLDPEIIKIVYRTFKQMYDDGLVYRAGRICNWCVKHQTNLADLETKYEERLDKFYYIKYGPFTIGTARPETKFGDKYLVVNPNDRRYLDYKDGQKFEVEWINGPITATIIKDQAADMEFGTGAMTITPWHDAIDFEIAQRRDLDMEQIIDTRGKLLPVAGEFAGMKITEARPKIVEKLQAKGLMVKIDERYKHNVQTCYKCGNIVEPQVIPQWYIAMTKKLSDGRPSLRDMAIQALDKKDVEIVTERFEKIYRNWMENLRDWPISRQIWWGIPIPVKYCEDCGEVIIDLENSVKACAKCKSEKLKQDPDTFDTWFSSCQWPYAALMANDAKRNTEDFKNFFPTQVMESGWDILFFWIARMVMLSYYKTNRQPFEKVYLHGLVRAGDRQKMSKSKGNVLGINETVDSFGADAIRMAVIFSTSAGNDIPLAEDKIKGMKHFANKLWNIARFILGTTDVVSPFMGSIDDLTADLSTGSRWSVVSLSNHKSANYTDADRAILEKLKAVIKTSTEHLENFRLHEAAQEIYHFTWKEFADVYIEASKAQLADEKLKHNTLHTLHYSLTTILKLIHPFMPFVTEEVWGKLGQKDLLMVAEWPN